MNDKEAWHKDSEEHKGLGFGHGWIQWKGTDVCMDVHCPCGAHGHIDARFAYKIQCAVCKRVFSVGQCVHLYELSGEGHDDDACIVAE